MYIYTLLIESFILSTLLITSSMSYTHYIREQLSNTHPLSNLDYYTQPPPPPNISFIPPKMYIHTYTHNKRLIPLNFKPTKLFTSQTEIIQGSPSPIENIISLTNRALKHLQKLRLERSPHDTMLLRIGVKSGGCSGLSYTLDIVNKDNICPSDFVDKYPKYGFNFHIESKSMLYILGMELDFSEDLIGGGFRFKNPNASRKCGCGMSFGVPKNFTSQEINQSKGKCSD